MLSDTVVSHIVVKAIYVSVLQGQMTKSWLQCIEVWLISLELLSSLLTLLYLFIKKTSWFYFPPSFLTQESLVNLQTYTDSAMNHAVFQLHQKCPWDKASKQWVRIWIERVVSARSRTWFCISLCPDSLLNIRIEFMCKEWSNDCMERIHT